MLEGGREATSVPIQKGDVCKKLGCTILHQSSQRELQVSSQTPDQWLLGQEQKCMQMAQRKF